MQPASQMAWQERPEKDTAPMHIAMITRVTGGKGKSKGSNQPNWGKGKNTCKSEGEMNNTVADGTHDRGLSETRQRRSTRTVHKPYTLEMTPSNNFLKSAAPRPETTSDT